MAEGEAPVNTVTRNLEFTVFSSVITTMKLSEFSPVSSSSALYGSTQSKIALGPSGLNACAFTGGYAQVSVLEWLSNPYAHSVSVKSPLLRLSLSAQMSPVISAATTLNRNLARATVHAPGVPVYSITLQFSGVQNFNFSVGKDYFELGKFTERTNFTLPACKLYNGVSYVPCKGCNISSYTNYNVTYGCFDITQLCPSMNLKRDLFENETENENENENYANSHSGSVAEFRSFDRRSLDIKSEESQAVTYGMVISSIKAEITTVLSSNPFKVNPAKSIVVLIFVSCLGGIIFIILIGLVRLDYSEKLQKYYVEKATDKVARKLLEETLKNGGHGDLREVYQMCSAKVQKDVSSKQGFTGSLNRSTARTKSNMSWAKGLIMGEKKAKSSIDSTKVAYPSRDLKQMNRLSARFSLTDIYNTGKEIKDHYVSGVKGNNRSSVSFSDMKDKDGSDDEEDGCDIPLSDRQIENTAIITEFLQKLFPGCSIFSGKNDAFKVIASNHDYFKMFIGSGVTKSRTIRFLDVVAVILSCIFADTIFFGIFYPSDSNCTASNDEVSVYGLQFASLSYYVSLTITLFHWLCVSPIIMNFVQLVSYVVELMIVCLFRIDIPLCMRVSHNIQ